MNIEIQMARDIEPGDKFGRWTVIRFAGIRESGGVKTKNYLCRCECGVEKEVRKGNLLNELSTQCSECDRRVKGGSRG